MRNFTTAWKVVSGSPSSLVDYLSLFRRQGLYFGQQQLHSSRILGEGFEAFDSDLPVHEVDDINGSAAKSLLGVINPDLVLVFGTRLIRPEIFGSLKAPVVNMHWGWSPTYRGEGIVTALAAEGPAALGVTVHIISERPDAGDILHRARPVVSEEDNFFALGLRLTLLGVGLFEQVIDQFKVARTLTGTPQDLSLGRLYSGKFMKKNPQIYHLAWKNLKRGTSGRSGTA